MAISDEIRAWRAAHRMSQPAAAQALGLPVATLRSWEQGRFEPDHPALLRLAMERLDELHPVEDRAAA